MLRNKNRETRQERWQKERDVTQNLGRDLVTGKLSGRAALEEASEGPYGWGGRGKSLKVDSLAAAAGQRQSLLT